ncbi:MAG: hypothetical protein ACD_73C00428G0001 [uncultured bacterium]|nr:MAG: hypothetical protein ACD_73C00428G0001 [uncultured bacterium]
MGIRDLLGNGVVVPPVTNQNLSQGNELSDKDKALLPRCEYLRSDRNFLLGYSASFITASGMMAKALYDHYPEVPEHRKDLYITSSKIIALAPLFIAGGFLKFAYTTQKTYHECLKDPRGTLARLAAEEESSEDVKKEAQREALNIREITGPATWLVGAAALARTVAYFGVTFVEGAAASGLALCAPGLRYFDINKRNDIL